MLILFTGRLIAQSGSTELVRLYQNLQYEEAVELGRSLLESPENLAPADLIKIHEYLGVVYFSIGQRDSARASFLSLLSLDPGHTLDATEFSPKIIDFFSGVKGSFRPPAENPVPMAYRQYIYVRDPRPSAAWRSVLLPGWGQYYKGQKKRGLLIGGAFFVSAGATIAALLKEQQTRDEYRNATAQPQIDDRYNRYNNWYKTRRSLSVVTAAVWFIGVADALWSGKPQFETRSAAGGGAALQISFPLTNQ